MSTTTTTKPPTIKTNNVAIDGFSPQSSANDYRIGALSGLPAKGVYTGSSIGEVLGKLAASPASLQAVWQYLVGAGHIPTSTQAMLKDVANAWSAAGSARGQLIDLYPQSGGYDPVTKNRTNTGSTNQPISIVMGSSGPGLDTMSAQMMLSAYGTVTDALRGWGLDSLAPSAWQLISDPGYHLNASLVLSALRGTQEYKDRFSGMSALQARGINWTEAQYISVESSIQQDLSSYAVPQGWLNNKEVGTLIANGIYGTNLQTRLQKGYDAMQAADPYIKTMLNQYYGVDQGQLLAYYLDPTKTAQDLIKQTQAAAIGTAAHKTGFAGVDKSIAEGLATSLPATAGGDPTSLTAGFQKAAGLQPLEQTMAGQRGQATVTSNQILENVFPGQEAQLGGTVANNTAALKLAEQARVAGLSGGGGYVQDAGGGVGVGRTSTAGTGK